VLGGDDYGTRVITAAKLVEARYVPYAIVSGPPSLLGHESDMTIEYARRHGFPTSLFRSFTHELNSTRSETAALGAYLRQNHAHKILLVTSNYHTRRAAKLMRTQVPDIQTVVIPAPDPYFTPSTWWKTRSGEKIFLYEWLKTVATEFGV
jgi:uncharacterized SAM-binding protein YcdF (DUF218 family)